MQEQFKDGFDRLCGFAKKANPGLKPSPVGLSALGCFLALAFAVEVAVPIVSLFKPDWVEPFVFLLGPLAVAFVVLYRSEWHRELVQRTRALRAGLFSLAIFGAVLFSTGAILVLTGVLWMTLFVGFRSIHY